MFTAIGIIIGFILSFGFFYFRYAATNPTITIGENTGRIITFNVQSWPTPNFLFQQEGHLPVILYPAVGEESLAVRLNDEGTITYSEFAEKFLKNEERFSLSKFVITYREDDVDELGYVFSITESQ